MSRNSKKKWKLKLFPYESVTNAYVQFCLCEKERKRIAHTPKIEFARKHIGYCLTQIMKFNCICGQFLAHSTENIYDRYACELYELDVSLLSS